MPFPRPSSPVNRPTVRLSPVDILGLDKVRAGVPLWLAAMNGGRRLAAKCDTILHSGCRCRNISIPEARFLNPPVFRCHVHMPQAAWARIDHLLRARGQMMARSANVIERENGLSMLRQVERREIRRRWAIDPEHEADLFHFAPADRKRIDIWLAAHGVDLACIIETGHPMTACRRNYVLLQTALHLSGRLSEDHALRAVRSAIKRDVKWFANKARFDPQPSWGSPAGE